MPVPAHPYPFALDEPLLWWSDAYPWTIRDACEGTQILGDVGSGKTSGSGKTIARSMLSAGFGGLVLCKKIDEAQTWIQYARETGRSEQLLIINPRQRWRFNFLQYTFERSGEGAGHVETPCSSSCPSLRIAATSGIRRRMSSDFSSTACAG